MAPKVSLTLIGIVLASILIVAPNFIIEPVRQKMVQMHAQVETLSTQIKTLTVRMVDIRRRSDKAQAELTQIQEQLHQQMDQLPALENISELAKSIIDRGAGLGLEFVSVLPVYDKMFTDQLVISSVSGRKLHELPVQIQVRGRYRELAQYLEALRDLRYYSRIDEVDIRLKERLESQGFLEMTVHLKILYL
jgi:Tfp pilus assembly protein PilO